MAWTSIRRINSYKLSMVNKDGDNLGILSGFVSGDVTFDRGSDLKKIATIQTRNDNYPENAFPMIKIEVSTNEGDNADLGTYAVKDVKVAQHGDAIIKDYDLSSVCYKAQTAQILWDRYLTGRITLRDAFSQAGLFEGIYDIQFENGVETITHNYGADGFLIEQGKTELEIISTLCNDYDVVYDAVDAHIAIKPYVNPATLPDEFMFDYDNGTISSDVQFTRDKFSTINRALTTYESDTLQLVGRADADAGSGVSIPVREQVISQTWEENNADPPEFWKLDELAKKHLEASMQVNNTYEFNGIYLGCNYGVAGGLKLFDGTHSCVIQKMQIPLTAAMETSYTLKEVFR